MPHWVFVLGCVVEAAAIIFLFVGMGFLARELNKR